jgi:hypothetical protein
MFGLDFEKGKADIVAPSKDKLPFVIDSLISAIRVGELDELSLPRPDRSGSRGKQLEHYRGSSRSRFERVCDEPECLWDGTIAALIDWLPAVFDCS